MCNVYLRFKTAGFPEKIHSIYSQSNIRKSVSVCRTDPEEIIGAYHQVINLVIKVNESHILV